MKKINIIKESKDFDSAFATNTTERIALKKEIKYLQDLLIHILMIMM